LPNINKIKDLNLPSPEQLKNSTEEEKVYTETPQESQIDHKGNEALKLLQDKARQENNKLKIENENLKNLADHRIEYSKWIFKLVSAVIAVVFIILLLDGFEIINLDKETLDILLKTNAVQVVGVLFIVAKWLYPNNK
jgi:hypothetical protein